MIVNVLSTEQHQLAQNISDYLDCYEIELKQLD